MSICGVKLCMGWRPSISNHERESAFLDAAKLTFEIRSGYFESSVRCDRSSDYARRAIPLGRCIMYHPRRPNFKTSPSLTNGLDIQPRNPHHSRSIKHHRQRRPTRNQRDPEVSYSAYLQDVVVTRPTEDWGDCQTSIYETRAWTLQEKILSTRCLLFSSEQVFFRCNAGIHPENEQEPIIKVTTGNSIARTNSVNPFSRATSLSADNNSKESLPWGNAFFNYIFLVKDYTGRNLSYPTDILNAFAGLESVFSRLAGGEFFCGHPESVFDRMLFWIPAEGQSTLIRRRTSIGFVNSREVLPPSWSWSGWEGRVGNIFGSSTSKLPSFNGGNLLVELYEVHSPGGIRTIRRLVDVEENRGSEDGKTRLVDRNGNVESRLFLGNVSKSMPFQTHLLVFEAQTLDGSVFTLYLKNQSFFSSWLLDSKGYQRGFLYHDIPPFTNEGKKKHKQKLGFVAICRTSCYNGSLNERALLKASSKREASVQKYVVWDCVAVMVVEWKCDEKGFEWAERVSVGFITEEAWKAAKPRMKVVKLA